MDPRAAAPDDVTRHVGGADGVPTTHIPSRSAGLRGDSAPTRNEPGGTPFVVRDQTRTPGTTEGGAASRRDLEEDPINVGRFSVVRKLGQGGMGRVYEARDPELGRRVAVKLLAGAATTDARERLRREARAMAAVTSPHVAAVSARLVQVPRIGAVPGQRGLHVGHPPSSTPAAPGVHVLNSPK